MPNNLHKININVFLANKEIEYLENITKTFSIPQNKEVENFIRYKAIQSYLLGQSSTYLVLNDEENLYA